MAKHELHEHFLGAVLVGERGQIVIPKEARDEFGIRPGDKLVVFSKHNGMLVLMKPSSVREFAERILGDKAFQV